MTKHYEKSIPIFCIHVQYTGYHFIRIKDPLIFGKLYEDIHTIQNVIKQIFYDNIF